jgi:hypothetical protein
LPPVANHLQYALAILTPYRWPAMACRKDFKRTSTQIEKPQIDLGLLIFKFFDFKLVVIFWVS